MTAPTMTTHSEVSLTSSRCTLDLLVDDILIAILSTLPAWDVLHLRQTSKRMEALSHVCAVWHALFARNVLKCGRPVPGCAFAPTPRLAQLIALEPSAHAIESDHDAQTFECDPARELVESSDLEARTLHALRLEKFWTTSTISPSSKSITRPGTPETRTRTFTTPTSAYDIFLLPGGRFVVSSHADRLLCWDLGVPHALTGPSTRCVGEWVFSRALADDKMGTMVCMDAHAPVHWRDASSVHFVLCPDIKPSWDPETPKRTCKVLSVRSDPLRGPNSSYDHSPFASPVPFFQCEDLLELPDELPIPVYLDSPEMTGIWGPHRFARGRLGELICAHGPLLFFASYIPHEGDETEVSPRYVGIEVLDRRDNSKTTLFEYPDPQVGPYVGMHAHTSSDHVIIIWQNAAGIYPLPGLSSSSSTPSSPSLSASSSPASTRPSSPGLSRSDVSSIPEPEPDVDLTPARERTRTVLMPEVIIALSEAVEAPVAFSMCCADGTELSDVNSSVRIDADALSHSPALTILARSRAHPDRNVHSVLIASPSPSSPSSPFNQHPELTFKLKRIPSPTQNSSSSAGPSAHVAALVLGPSGRGVRADANGALYRCKRAEVVLPSGGFGYGYGTAGEAKSVSTVDFWPWRRAAALSFPTTSQEGERADSRLVVRFDDGMGRVVAAQVPSVGSRSATSEVTIMDFA